MGRRNSFERQLIITLAFIGYVSGFTRRQMNSTGPPAQCVEICTAVQNSTEACGQDDSCVCTETIFDSLRVCAQCRIDATNVTGSALSSTVSNLQSTIDETSTECVQSGFSVPAETLTVPSNASSASVTQVSSKPIFSPPATLTPTTAAATSSTPSTPSTPSPTSGSSHRASIRNGLVLLVGSLAIISTATIGVLL